MECKNVQNILIDFIEGNISADIKVQIEEHLLTCNSCRKEHKQLRLLLDDMSMIEDQIPHNHLKEDFYTMLEEAKENRLKLPKPLSHTRKFSMLKYAAVAIILLGFGYFLGRNTKVQSKQSSEIAALRYELQTMQQTATMASLSHSTASQRLKAINTINDQIKSDDNTINVLLNTLMNDDNINVRMAAANALIKHSTNDKVRESFISVLEDEKDPAMQITLINLLTQMQETKAKKAFQKIIQDENSIPVVKEQAQEGLKVFI